MIKSLTVTNHLNEELSIVLGESDTSGFLITGIEGLGPSKATINSTEMATGDGSIYNSSRLEARNIVISMVFDYRLAKSMEDIRHKCYRYFPVKKKIKLVIETDTRSCEIEGYVESNEPTIFSPREGTQISILCPYPYFYAHGEGSLSITEFSSVEPVFEFPFSNESLDTNMIELSRLALSDYHNLVYKGDAEIGILIQIKVFSQIGDIKIGDSDTNEVMVIHADKVAKITGGQMDNGDIITISTLFNNKYVRLLRNGISYNILNSLNRSSPWFTLQHGDNLFTFSTTFGRASFSIENRTLYEGA